MKKLLQKNKKAYFDYTIEESLECGIELLSYEIKSIIEGRFNLKGCFAKIIKNEVHIFDMHVAHYKNLHRTELLEEYRPRKLLLHKKQINKYKETLKKSQGFTLIPLEVYTNDKGKCKVLLGLCKGKKLFDKRATEKAKDILRDSQAL
jgi:SsrA-binding protein